MSRDHRIDQDEWAVFVLNYAARSDDVPALLGPWIVRAAQWATRRKLALDPDAAKIVKQIERAGSQKEKQREVRGANLRQRGQVKSRN